MGMNPGRVAALYNQGFRKPRGLRPAFNNSPLIKEMIEENVGVAALVPVEKKKNVSAELKSKRMTIPQAYRPQASVQGYPPPETL